MSFSPKRPFLLAILLILCVPVTLCTAFVIWYVVEIHRFANGSGPISDVSVAEVGGVKLQLERRYAHPFLSEYLRAVTVTDAKGTTTRHDLGLDSGNAGKLSVCETTSGEILLADPLQAFLLSVDGKLQQQAVASPQTPACVKPLGAFDRTGEKSYGFVPG